jgi:K+-sensing histidine kinase KdpD
VNKNEPDNHKATVLVVDDEPFFREVVRSNLEGEPYNIIEASSGKEVEFLISRHPVSVVLTDIEMPGMSGQDVLKVIKRLQPDLPVIMISSHQDFKSARQVLRDGALDYLVKPFAKNELCQSVERAVTFHKKAVETRHHQEESERRLADLVLLREVGETANGEADFQSLLERILDFVSEAISVETVSLMLVEDAGFLTIKASRGLPEKVVYGTRVPIEEGVAGHVFQTGEPVLLVDMDEDGRFVPSGDEGQYSTRSALSLPLRTRDRVVGVLNVNNKRNGETFTAADQYFLASVAHQATMAIENLDLVNRLKNEARRLEVLNRVRTRLVCNLSHELRTPLTSVLGFADLLLNYRDIIQEPDKVDYLEKIQDGSLQMDRLISEMMLLFSLDSDTVTWKLERFDLGALCHEILNGVADQIEKSKISINVWVSKQISKLNNDTEKLRAVLEALIDNAIKFNRPDGLISITADLINEDTSKFYLRIFNSGNKIPDEAIEEIFVPYSQLGDLNTDKPKGVGIGLTLCKAVLEKMRGEIRLVSSNNEGTTFAMVLPLDCTHFQESVEL